LEFEDGGGLSGGDFADNEKDFSSSSDDFQGKAKDSIGRRRKVAVDWV